MSSSLLELHETYDAIKARPKYPYSRRFLTDVYPRYMEPYRETAISVLEVGCYNGGALKALRDYFPNAQITGVDITGRADDQVKGEHRIRFMRGDQGDPEFLWKVGLEEGSFDFIIEDGSHRFADQVTTFQVMFHYLAPGGVYFVEDVIPCWNGEQILEYFRAMVTDNRFVTQNVQPIESISFHQGIIAITKSLSS